MTSPAYSHMNSPFDIDLNVKTPFPTKEQYMFEFNTALEKLSDTIHPEKNAGIGSAKDIAAGSVLITAIAALVVGIIIFAPKLYLWISSN